ncbi:MAG: EamA family transporter [Faecousia sp.]
MAAAVFLVCACVLCYTGQSFFNKLYADHYTGPYATATPVFAIIYGLFTGIATLVYNGFRFEISSVTLILGIASGVTLFIFNLSLINASRTGPYAFQCIMRLFGNILLPLLFSVLCWGDHLTVTQIVGIGIMLLSLLIFNRKGLHFQGLKKGYFLWVALLFLTNGIYGILLDCQQRLMERTQRNEMIITTFLVSSLISLAYLLILEGKRAPGAFRMEKKTWTFVLLSSVCATLAVNILMLAMRLVPVSVLYTVDNVGVLILSALLGVVVLHEKLEKHMIAGIAVAVAGLIILSV